MSGPIDSNTSNAVFLFLFFVEDSLCFGFIEFELLCGFHTVVVRGIIVSLFKKRLASNFGFIEVRLVPCPSFCPLSSDQLLNFYLA